MQFGFSSSEIKIKELVQEYMTKIKWLAQKKWLRAFMKKHSGLKKQL